MQIVGNVILGSQFASNKRKLMDSETKLKVMRNVIIKGFHSLFKGICKDDLALFT